MSVSLVAKRYATALFDLGEETGQLDQLTADFVTLAQMYESNGELRNAVANPLVTIDAKKAIMADVLAAMGAGQMTRNAVLLLVDRRRMPVLPYVAEALQQKADAKRGVLRALVTSATALSEEYYGRLQRQLETMTGKKVVLDKKEDPTLIAGVVTRIGDRVFDGSLRARLDAMKASMLPN